MYLAFVCVSLLVLLESSNSIGPGQTSIIDTRKYLERWWGRHIFSNYSKLYRFVTVAANLGKGSDDGPESQDNFLL